MYLLDDEKRYLAKTLGVPFEVDRFGYVSDPSLGKLINHIEGCPKCGNRLSNLRKRDASQPKH